MSYSAEQCAKDILDHFSLKYTDTDIKNFGSYLESEKLTAVDNFSEKYTTKPNYSFIKCKFIALLLEGEYCAHMKDANKYTDNSAYITRVHKRIIGVIQDIWEKHSKSITAMNIEYKPEQFSGKLREYRHYAITIGDKLNEPVDVNTILYQNKVQLIFDGKHVYDVDELGGENVARYLSNNKCHPAVYELCAGHRILELYEIKDGCNLHSSLYNLARHIVKYYDRAYNLLCVEEESKVTLKMTLSKIYKLVSKQDTERLFKNKLSLYYANNEFTDALVQFSKDNKIAMFSNDLKVHILEGMDLYDALALSAFEYTAITGERYNETKAVRSTWEITIGGIVKKYIKYTIHTGEITQESIKELSNAIKSKSDESKDYMQYFLKLWEYVNKKEE